MESTPTKNIDLAELAEQIKRGWRSSGKPNAAAVFKQYPQVADCRSLALDFAVEEYCFRRETGEDVDASDYCAGFPEIHRSLARQIEVLEWMDQNPAVVRRSESVAWPDIGEMVLGKFLVSEELGRGSLARAYLCEQPAVGKRQVVLKLAFDGEYEAVTLGRLNHPSIMPVFSIDVDSDTRLSGMCMPFRGRSTLYDLLDVAWQASHRPPDSVVAVYAAAGRYLRSHDVIDCLARREMPPGAHSYQDAVLVIAADLTAALDHAHSHGIIHGDLKPSNILLTPEGRPLLMDFNLSKDGLSQSTLTGGTMPYMSPEQLQCVILGASTSGEIDWRTDLYSLGVILYELLTGRLPFPPPRHPSENVKRAADQMLQQQRQGAIDPFYWNPSIDRELAGKILQCLQFDAATRPGDFPPWRLSPDTHAASETEIVRPIGWWTAATCATLLLALATGIYAFFSNQQSAVPSTTTIEENISADEAVFREMTNFANQELWAEAIEYANASPLEFQTPKLVALLGYCHQELSQQKGQGVHLYTAATLYREALERGFESAGLFHNMGQCVRRQRSDKEEAAAWFARAIDLDSGACGDLAKYGLAHLQLDTISRSEDYVPVEERQLVEELLAKYPNCPNLEFVAACVFSRCAHFESRHRPTALGLWRDMVRHLGPGRLIIIRDTELLQIFHDEPAFEDLLRKREPVWATRIWFPRCVNPVTNQPSGRFPNTSLSLR